MANIEKSTDNHKQIFYGWWVLIVCILINITTHVLNFQVNALYLKPITVDWGVSRGVYSLQTVLMVLSSVVAAPILGKLYKKYDTRLVLGGCTLSTALLILARAYVPNIKWFFVISVFQGITLTGSTALPISILITAWFKKKRGFAISMASIGISVGGVMFSPIIEYAISSWGWRGAYKFSALIIMLILPLIVLVVRKNPEEKGLLPYGAQDMDSADLKAAAVPGKRTPAKDGLTLKQAAASPILYVFLFGIFSLTICSGASFQIAAYLSDIGYTSAFAAKVMSAYMAVGIAGKILLGQVSDKFGEKKAAIFVCLVAACAYIFIIFAKNPVFLVLMVVFYGITTSITSILPPLITSRIFGAKDYSQIYGTVISVNRFGGAVGTFFISMLFDITGNYKLVWPSCSLLMIISLICFLFCLGYAAKGKSE